MAQQAIARARAVDWLRGGAALAMVQCHALVLLRPELREQPLFALAQFVDGLVAPAFYACAGFALAYTLCAAARSGKLARRSGRVAVRTGQVLLVSAGMLWLWFPIFQEPRWLLRIDVLSCIGLSLAALLPPCAALARRPRLLGATSLALAALVLLAAPALSGLDGVASHFVNVRGGSVFPLVPWGAHLAFGAAAGAFSSTGIDGRRLWGWLGLGALALSVACSLGQELFPPHDPWSEPANQFQRLALLSGLAAALALVEVRVGSRSAGPARRALEWYGTCSLALYALHEIWLYTPRLGFCFNDRYGGKLGWSGYALATVALLGLSTACIIGWELAKQGAVQLASKVVRRDEREPDARIVPDV